MLHWATTLSLLVRPAAFRHLHRLLSRRPFAACYPDAQYRYCDHSTQSVTQASYASVLRRVAADDSLLTVLTKAVRGATPAPVGGCVAVSACVCLCTGGERCVGLRLPTHRRRYPPQSAQYPAKPAQPNIVTTCCNIAGTRCNMLQRCARRSTPEYSIGAGCHLRSCSCRRCARARSGISWRLCASSKERSRHARPKEQRHSLGSGAC